MSRTRKKPPWPCADGYYIPNGKASVIARHILAGNGLLKTEAVSIAGGQKACYKLIWSLRRVLPPGYELRSDGDYYRLAKPGDIESMDEETERTEPHTIQVEEPMPGTTMPPVPEDNGVPDSVYEQFGFKIMALMQKREALEEQIAKCNRLLVDVDEQIRVYEAGQLAILQLTTNPSDR